MVSASTLTDGERTDNLAILGIIPYSLTVGNNVVSTTAHYNGTDIVVLFQNDLESEVTYPIRFVTIYFKSPN